MAEIEREAILDAVAEHGIDVAAQVLAIGRTTIYRKINGYGVDLTAQRDEPSLVVSARKCADYMMRCIGTAKTLGTELDQELKNWRQPPCRYKS